MNRRLKKNRPIQHDADSTQFRLLIRLDMDEVLTIERRTFESPWTEREFLCCLNQRNVLGVVAELRNTIVGFMLYELNKTSLRIVNFAVDPEARRKSFGRQIVQRLIDKLAQQGRRQIVAEVRETNGPAQLFFAACGFRAVGVLKDHYETGEDAYRFVYTLPREDGFTWSHTNRISGKI